MSTANTSSKLSRPLHKNVVLIAGEASGDFYAGDLITSLKKIHPDTHFSGMAGSHAETAGMKLWYDYSSFSTMGWTEALRNYRKYYTLQQDLQNQILAQNPDLLILIDYAGLNLRLAKFAHEHNITCFYYIPPKVWAWNKKRIHKLRRYANNIAVLYPFEATFFRGENLPVSLILHPLSQKLEYAHPPVGMGKNIAILPGSRKSEIDIILPIQLASCYALKLKHKTPLHFFIFLSDSSQTLRIQRTVMAWRDKLDISLIPTAQKYDTLKKCHAALAMSGTITIELALLGIPHILLAKGSLINYLIYLSVYSNKWVGLPNLIMQKSIVPELIQYECSEAKIVAHLEAILFTQQGIVMRQDLLEMRTRLTNPKTAVPIESLVSNILYGLTYASS